jgi:hypothetical protein
MSTPTVKQLTEDYIAALNEVTGSVVRTVRVSADQAVIRGADNEIVDIVTRSLETELSLIS